jgi:hypothetical protein
MPVARPTDDPPQWATADVVDPVTGVNNVIAPPDEKVLNGWNRFEHPARQWLNWFQRLAGQWLEYLADRDQYMPINTVGIGVGGTAAFPPLAAEDQRYSGTIFAANINNPAQFCFGFVLGDDSGYQVAPIATATLSFGSISGRNIVITGLADGDAYINTTIYPVQTLNVP